MSVRGTAALIAVCCLNFGCSSALVSNVAACYILDKYSYGNILASLWDQGVLHGNWGGAS